MGAIEQLALHAEAARIVRMVGHELGEAWQRAQDSKTPGKIEVTDEWLLGHVDELKRALLLDAEREPEKRAASAADLATKFGIAPEKALQLIQQAWDQQNQLTRELEQLEKDHDQEMGELRGTMAHFEEELAEVAQEAIRGCMHAVMILRGKFEPDSRAEYAVNVIHEELKRERDSVRTGVDCSDAEGMAQGEASHREVKPAAVAGNFTHDEVAAAIGRMRATRCTLWTDERGTCPHSLPIDELLPLRGKPVGWCYYCWVNYSHSQLQVENTSMENQLRVEAERADILQRKLETATAEHNVTRLELARACELMANAREQLRG